LEVVVTFLFFQQMDNVFIIFVMQNQGNSLSGARCWTKML